MLKTMFSLLNALLLRLLLIAVSMAMLSMATEAGSIQSRFAEVGTPTSIPYGWVDFCGRHPEECSQESLAPINIALTRQVQKSLALINQSVNAFIQPVSNIEHWGTSLDHWDYPDDGKGDCKIYALYKRKLLMDAGFPRQALLMTIVRDLTGNGHTILMVKTNKGDLILDNLTDSIRPWDETGYKFLKRQAQENPNIWLSMGEIVGKKMMAARN